MSKGSQILVLLIILGAVIFIVYPFFVSKEGTMMSVRMYDKDGNLLRDTATYSIVGGTPGVAQIDLTVTITNTGSEALTCNLQTLSPTAFNTAMTKSEKQVLPGNKIAWTSAKISVAQFEGTTQIFQAPVICSYGTTTLPTKTGSLSLVIAPESTGGAFNVDLSAGGVGTEYCGDTICQVSETASTCPADCAAAPTNVKFRTSDVTYVSGSAIAYTATCGNDLTGYKFYYQGSGTSGVCPATVVYSGNTLSKAYVVPGGWRTGGTAATLYLGTGNYRAICDDDGSTYNFIYFSSTTFVIGSVDLTKSSINPTKEVSC